MSSTQTKKLLPAFDSVKGKDEKILWTGKPKFIPFILSESGSWLFTISFGVIWILMTINPKHDDGNKIRTYFWLFGLLALLQGLYAFLRRIFSFSNTVYGYSDKRVMMRTGFIGTDFKTIDSDKISEIEVTVNVLEKMFNVGTIRFYSGSTKIDDGHSTKLYDTWSSTENPYEIFKLLKQTST